MLRSNSPFFRGRRAALRMLPASVSCSCSACWRGLTRSSPRIWPLPSRHPRAWHEAAGMEQ